jgi:K+-transporting ATPase ATPase C chain
MLQHFRAAFVLLALFTLLVGIGYPLAMTGIGQSIFPKQANGSLIRMDGQVIGSELIGQRFSKPEYFWSRPSGAGKDGYDARSSSGSNYGPSSRALTDRITADAAKFGGPVQDIPSDLLTASGSGLDPDISPAAARYQIERVAAARKLAEADVSRLVEAATKPSPLGVLGDPHVNVLDLNLALDALSPLPPSPTPQTTPDK